MRRLGRRGEGSIPSILTNKDFMAGKGDKQRPTDHVAYASNYDAIFGKRNLLGYGVAENTTDFDSVVPSLNLGTPASTENTDLNQSVE